MPVIKLRMPQPTASPKADFAENGPEHSMDPTTDTIPATSFFSLPGELRNHIYELHISTYKPAWTRFTNGRLKTTWSPPLARTCRQMRSEVLSLNPQVEPQLSDADKIFAVVTDFDFTPLILLLRDAKYHDIFNGLPNVHKLLLINRMRLHLRFTGACLDSSFDDAYDLLKKANHFECEALMHNVPLECTASFDPPNMRFEFCELWKMIQRSPLGRRGRHSLRGSIRCAFRSRDSYIARQVVITDLENLVEGLQRAKCGVAGEKRKVQEGSEEPAARKKIRIGKKLASQVETAERRSLESATESE